MLLNKKLIGIFIGLSLLVGCESVPVASAPVAAVTVSAGNAYSLLGPGDSPLHIGDGIGQIGDIRREFPKHVKFIAPKHATWAFNVDHPLTTLHLSIHVYSTEEKGRFDCPTVLELNGTQLLDFRELPGAGAGKTVAADITVKGDQLLTGANQITVREVLCRGIHAWNDSVITSVALKAE